MTGFPVGEQGAHGPLRLVISSFPDEGVARRTSRAVVEGGFAACATRLPSQSVYRWKGVIEEVEEVLVLFKTSPKKVGALIEEIRRQHPYEIPEIFEVDIPRAPENYLRWVLSLVDSDPEGAALAASAPKGAGPRPRKASPSKRQA